MLPKPPPPAGFKNPFRILPISKPRWNSRSKKSFLGLLHFCFVDRLNHFAEMVVLDLEVALKGLD